LLVCDGTDAQPMPHLSVVIFSLSCAIVGRLTNNKFTIMIVVGQATNNGGFFTGLCFVGNFNA
jgi:hypothetical protein